MSRLISLLSSLVIVMPLGLLYCSVEKMAGGGTIETTNGRVNGMVVDAGGNPAAGVRVKLIPADYDPFKNADTITEDTTDIHGLFVFSKVDSGDYSIQSIRNVDGTSALYSGVVVSRDTVTIDDIVLRLSGAVKIRLSDSFDVVNGYVYVPGTTFAKNLSGSAGFIVLDSVPAGLISAVFYAQKDDSVSSVIRYDVHVLSGDTAAIEYPEWKYSRPLYLNTAASGAGVGGNVFNFPVLVRLTSGNFNFTQAHAGGGELRFANKNNVQLPYEIERWDSAAGLAEAWVKVDTVYGSNNTQSISMYWGNPSAVSLSNSAAVFDTAGGFQGAWHLGDAPGDSIRDATANRYLGVSPDSGKPQVSEGIIGNCRWFDGYKDYIDMPNTASGKLNFAENGVFTISAWVYADTLDSTYRTIVAKGHQQYFLQLTFFPGNKPWWEFSNFHETSKWNMLTSPATGKQWVLLTGVLQGGSQYLYCNGERVDDTTMKYSQNVSRDDSEDFTIGRFFHEAGIPIFGYCYFKGKIDEAGVSNVARNGDWIRLCYMNQRSDDKLVQFK